MEIEALSLEAANRPSALIQVKTYKEDYQKMKRAYENWSRTQKPTDRSLLFGNKHVTPEDMEAGIFSPTDRLLEDYDGIDATSQRLDRTQRMALEAEQIGVNVLGDLRRQREQIQRASRVLHDADHELDQSNRVLRDIKRIMTTNRLLTTLVMIILIIAILFVLYHKIF